MKIDILFILICFPILGVSQLKSNHQINNTNNFKNHIYVNDSLHQNLKYKTLKTENASSQINSVIMDSRGLTLPKVGLDNPNLPFPYLNHETGSLIYNINKNNNVSPGFYGNDGEKWARINEEKAQMVYNVKDFGAKGDNVQNDFLSIQSAINKAVSTGGGIVFFPAGNYYIDNTILIQNSTGILLMGVGSFGGTTINYGKNTGDIIKLQGSHHCSIKGIGFKSSDEIVMTSGNAIVLELDCYVIELTDLRFDYCYNGIWIKQATESRLSKIQMIKLLGDYGIKFGGGGINAHCYRAVISDILCNNQYYLDYPNVNLNSNPKGVGNWVSGVKYSTKDIVLSNGNIYQCVQSGTSGITSPIGNGNGFIKPQSIVDGTVLWKFISKQLIWIIQESNAYSLVLEKAALINGYSAYSMQSFSNPLNPPLWVFGIDLECDHNYQSQLNFLAGEGAYISTSWLGSCLDGNLLI